MSSSETASAGAWLARIEGAKTLRELEAVGAELSGPHCNETSLALSVLYEARRKELATAPDGLRVIEGGRPMMSEKPYLSHSQVNLFSNCAEAYRRRYIEREIIPPGVAALRGRGVHGAAEINHKQKIESGVDMPTADMVDAAVTAFRETQQRDGYALTEEEQSEGVDKVIGKAIDSTVRLTELYATKVAPTIDPELVEAKVRIELPDAPFDMLGVLDVATKDGRIKDLKTSAKAKRQSDADSSLQLTWYDLTYQAAMGRESTALDLEVLVDSSKPKHQHLTTTRTRRDFDVLVSRVNATVRAIQSGSFPPANPGAWNCSRKWCGYFSTCVYVNAERKDTSDE